MAHWVQRALAAFALCVLGPLLLVLALLVRIDSRGPALYRADRVGRDGRVFRCLKLRTMRWEPNGAGGRLTVEADDRVTRLGGVLRRLHLDELPQLVNVVRGEMNLVGPRPEDPAFVDPRDPLHRLVFRAMPGITGVTQLAFANEAAMLGSSPVDAAERYRTVILPQKVALDIAYLDARTWRLDLWILWQTARAALGQPLRLPPPFHAPAAPADGAQRAGCR